jgi:hypothetical protein
MSPRLSHTPSNLSSFGRLTGIFDALAALPQSGQKPSGLNLTDFAGKPLLIQRIPS